MLNVQYQSIWQQHYIYIIENISENLSEKDSNNLKMLFVNY